ncbi:hypothetical protein GIS00_03920 [Nakamurella sp. YIM 132087]|uniref:DUF4345 domain-containing protein n=1 Tax=Nakamurella alba TaxID=2665158 RepID=A0A7K1FJR5_9ACTN|nr:hypothetical protein [Nakamurella alba]MTD13094.1 hypothetical protein [Nakamurella alba]
MSHEPQVHGAGAHDAGVPGPPVPARPGQVTAAASMGLVVGVAGILALPAQLFFRSTTPVGFDAWRPVFVALFGAASILGGILAVRGRSSRPLAGVAVVGVLASIIGGAVEVGILRLPGFVVEVLILVLLFQGASRSWFRARGGTTF